MTEHSSFEGGCSCAKLRYRITDDPLIVHACHCRQCQRVSGSAFATNAIVEKNRVELLCGDIEKFHIADTYHTVYFCPECATYVWSEYNSGRFDDCWFMKVGTLDEPDRLPPDIHIFIESKQPWVVIPEQAPSFERFYSVREVWAQTSIERMEVYWGKGPGKGPAS